MTLTDEEIRVKVAEQPRYGRLVFMGIASLGRRTKWRMQCDCGKEFVGVAYDIKRGHTRSCGCLAVDTTALRSAIHGGAQRKRHCKEYRIWSGMKARCANKEFPGYGAAGIVVCERWQKSFDAFLEDMGRCPKGCSLDRRNGKGNYEPDNCRWATQKEQSSNRCNNIRVTIGEQTKIVSEWADEFGLKRSIAYDRIKYG